jgi:hypothetical protein
MKIAPTEALRPVSSATPRAPAPGPAAPPPSEPFARVLDRLGRRIDEGEKAVDRAASRPSASMDPGEMLALQAQVYRYVEAVDLATKIVERGTSAVKTTLQNQ